MKKVSGLLAVLFAATLVAQTPLPPKIPVEVLKQFYAADAAQQRAQRELDSAQRDIQSANDGWKQAVSSLQKICGDKFALKQDTVNTDPYCVAKPEPEKPSEKK
jgi:hypothetical protein